jgi:CrcB protein
VQNNKIKIAGVTGLRKYILIGIGGFLGAVLRYAIKSAELKGFAPRFPIDTFLINIAGSFLLAFVMTAAYESWNMNSGVRLGIATGFLGAFTTFSTVCKETVALIGQGRYGLAVGYVLLSAAVGIAAAYLGMYTARNGLPLFFSNSGKAPDADTAGESEPE